LEILETRAQPVLKVLLHPAELELPVKLETLATPAIPEQPEHWDTVVRKAYVATLATLAIPAERAKPAELVKEATRVIQAIRAIPAERAKLEEPDKPVQLAIRAIPADLGQPELDPPGPPV
jgi:hypothetical protein